MIAFFNYLGLIGAFLSASLILPALVGFGTSDIENGFKLLIYAAIGGFLSAGILLGTRGRKIRLDRVGAIYLAVISWIFFPIVLAIPLSDLFSISYSHAIFEAVSAFTTTAANGVQNLEAAPATAIFLRSNLQWTGGLATLLTFVLFLGPIRAGGLPKPRRSMGEATGRTTGSINRIAWTMFRYYLIATLVCFVLLMLSGVNSFSSLILASTAVTAGGYIPAGKELTDIAPPLALIVMALFFIIASTSVYWHRMIFKWQVENLMAHRESYYLLGAVLLLSFVTFVVIFNASGQSNSDGYVSLISEAIFNATSLVSTSGLQSRPGIFALLAPSLVFTVLLVGGGSNSIAGGIKYYRLGAMLFHSSNELARLIYPSNVAKPHFGTETFSLDLLKSIWTMFAVTIVIIAVGGVLMATSGLDYQASFTVVIAAITNAGPAYSIDWVPRGTQGWIAYADMDISQKLILCSLMLVGRLEIIAVIVALNPVYWLRR